MYRYTKLHLAMHGLLVSLSVFLLIFGENIAYQAMGLFVVAIMGKDLLISVTTEFIIDDKGLLEKSKFRTRYKMLWSEIDYVTKTRKNRKWIIVGNYGKEDHKDKYFTLRPTMKNYESMTKDIIEKVMEVKKLAVHEDLLPRLGLKYKLDSKGYIKKN